MSTPNPTTIAAIDLGSNSFHMIVARVEQDDNFRVVDRMRSMVRLAAGLDGEGNLTDKATARALACLEQFGERVRSLPRGAVRVVGTNTLRKARNAAVFIARAEAALGHAIDIISGYEEARLIYLGVSHGLDDEADIRLVVDIGGGSTEFILGRRFDPLYMESLHMGCVSHSAMHLADGVISAATLHAAEIAARLELEPLETNFRRIGWQSEIGASGSIIAIRDVISALGFSQDGITPPALARLKQVMIEAGRVERLDLPSLSEERRPVFAGGVAILAATFDALGLARMRVSQSALREGLLYDLLGRIQQEDVRERTVAELVQRYQVEREQGDRIDHTAQRLLAQCPPEWQLAGEDQRRLLHWAAQLHEIGLAISHSQYQKHGEYLLSNHDMPGFARGEQRRLAALVRNHRRKLALPELHVLPPDQVAQVLRLVCVLRLAYVLHRRRASEHLPEVEFGVEGDTLRLRFPAGWLNEHPLTRADLEQEASYLKPAGFKLKFK